MFFENSSLKGISGQNMSDPLKWSLTDDSRCLQAAVVKNLLVRAKYKVVPLELVVSSTFWCLLVVLLECITSSTISLRSKSDC